VQPRTNCGLSTLNPFAYNWVMWIPARIKKQNVDAHAMSMTITLTDDLPATAMQAQTRQLSVEQWL